MSDDGLIRICDSRADRDAWLEARKAYVCGSEAAQVLGSSKWGDRDGAMRRKAGLETLAETERMWWGRAMQDTIVESLGDAPGETKGWHAESFEWLIRDPECEHVAATPDCWIEHPELGRVPGEIKLTGYQWRVKAADRDIPGVSPVPIDYQIQCQMAMACTGATHCILIEQHSNMTHPHIFERHEGVIARVRKEAPIFLAEVARLKGERDDGTSDSAA